MILAIDQSVRLKIKPSSLRLILLLIITNVDRNGLAYSFTCTCGLRVRVFTIVFRVYADRRLRNPEKERAALGRGPRRMKKDVRNIHIG